MTRRSAAAALVALALAACSTRPASHLPAAGGPGRDRLPAGAPTTTIPGRGASVSRAVQSPPISRPSATAKPGTTEDNPSNHFAVAFDMPACVERARPAKAVVRTAAASMLIASASYADGANHGGLWSGATDTRGEFTIAWTPPPTAPLGPAKILVGVNGERGGATAQRHFVLAAPGGCA